MKNEYSKRYSAYEMRKQKINKLKIKYCVVDGVQFYGDFVRSHRFVWNSSAGPGNYMVHFLEFSTATVVAGMIVLVFLFDSRS